MINYPSNSNVYNQFLRFQTPQSQPAAQKRPNAPYLKNAPITAITLKQIKEEKNNEFIKTVAVIAILSSIAGLFLTKGLPKNFYQKINSYLQVVDDKIFEYMQKHPSMNLLQKGYLNFNKGLRKVLEVMKCGNNITAIKDVAFKWFCDKVYLKKPMDWITKQFKKITVRTSTQAYQDARNIADTNIAKLRELIPIVRQRNQKAAAELTILLQDLENQVHGITNATTRSTRLKGIQQATTNIGDNVGSELWHIIKNPTKENLEKLRLYRTEVHAAPGKEALTSKLREAKRTFTFNVDDKTKILTNAKIELGQIIKTEDVESRTILRKISKQIKEYSQLSGSNEAVNRTKLVNEMQKELQNLKNAITSQKYSQETQKLINLQINEIETILKMTEQKGTLEEILILLNKSGFKTSHLDDYNRAKLLTSEIRNTTNKAFETELKLYDKYAEYSVGSAPTDVVGIIVPMVLGGYAISKGDNKDEKVSATLKAGIPIIGAVATTFVAAAKMMSNMQGLILGGLAGLALNLVGSKTDETYKKYNEDKLYAQKAIAAYKKKTMA